MPESAGGVSISIGADTKDFNAAIGDLTKRMNALEASIMSNSKSISGATKNAAGQSITAFDALKNSTGHLEEKMGKVEKAVGGMAGAMGQAGGPVKELLGGFGDLAMTFATGGPLLAGVSLIGGAVAMAINDMSKVTAEAAKAAEEAAAKASQEIDRMAARASALRAELQSLITGESITKIEGRIAAKTAKAEMDAATGVLLGAVRDSLGGAAKSSLLNKKQLQSGDPYAVEDAISATDFSFIKEEDRAKVVAAAETVKAASQKYASTLTVVGLELETEAVRAQQASEDKKIDLANAETLRESSRNLAATQVLLAEHYKAIATSKTAAVAAKEESDQSGYTAERAYQASQAIAKHEASIQTVTLDEALGEVNRMLDAADASAEAVNSFNAAMDSQRAALEAAKAAEEARTQSIYDANKAAIAAVETGVAKGAVAAATGDGKSMGQEAGKLVGGLIGGAAGDMLGGLIGNLLGDALDPLLKGLNLVGPLMEGLGIFLTALMPIFDALKIVMAVVGQLFVALTPYLAMLVNPIAQVIEVLANLIATIMPLIQIALPFLLISIMPVIVGLQLIAPLLTLASQGLQFLAKWTTNFYNWFVDVMNGIIEWLRSIPGISDDFGVLLEKQESAAASVDTPESTADVIARQEELTAASKENTDAINKNTEAMSGNANLPAWVRIEKFIDEFAGRKSAASYGDAAYGFAGTQQTFNGTINVTAKSSSLVDAMSRSIQQRGRQNRGNRNNRNNNI